MGFVVKKSQRRGQQKHKKALKKLRNWQKNMSKHTKKEAYHGQKEKKEAD